MHKRKNGILGWIAGWMVFGIAAASFGVACSEYDVVTEDIADHAGIMQMPLIGEGTSGAIYRLRNANFRIQGPSYLYLYSENYLNEEVISAELLEGDYLIELYSNWYLERKTSYGYRRVDAVLMSKNPTGFTIYDQFRTRVAFQFKVGDDVITPGYGEIDIVIEVDDSDAGSADGGVGDGGIPDAAPDAG